MYQVHPLKSDLVHLTTKTIATKGAELLFRPWQLPFPPARGTKTLSCPWQLPFPPAKGAKALFCPAGSVTLKQVDQVHFQVPYQVHRMCPGSASEAGFDTFYDRRIPPKPCYKAFLVEFWIS